MEHETAKRIAAQALAALLPALTDAIESGSSSAPTPIHTVLAERFASRPSAQEALSDLEKTPQDEDLQASVRSQIRRLLDEDPAFTAELQSLLESSPAGSVNASNRGVAAGQLRGTVITGDIGGSVSIGGSGDKDEQVSP